MAGNSKRIEISSGTHLAGIMAGRFSGLLQRLGNLETRVLAEDIANICIESPVYISGLARSGSTILLEMLSEAPGVCTHKYRDYPYLDIPYFWNWFVDRAARPVEAAERAHKDGIVVSPESPEAMEEILWIKFFPDAHDEGHSNVLDASTRHPVFEDYYRAHIRKLLFVRKCSRYLSKGNYNVSRLSYLRSIFPDARFVVPVRSPVNHIASLLKQHDLFSREERRDERILRHMQRAGHYEFGLNRTAINFGNDNDVASVRALWESQPVRGWARYWSHVYRFLLDSIERDPDLADAVLIVRYEDLCGDPQNVLRRIFAHCRFEEDTSLLERLSARPKVPTYYSIGFDQDELLQIRDETREVRHRLEYRWP